MDDLDDLEDAGEELADDIGDELDRRAVLGGAVALLGAGGAGYFLTRGDGDGGTGTPTGGESSPEPLDGDVSGTPAADYIESFEDGDLAEYDTPDSGSAVDSAHAYHGDGSLHLRSSDGPAQVRTDSVETLPGAGDRFRYRFYPTPVQSDGGANVTFALDDAGRGYQILCNFWKSKFQLKRKDENERVTLAGSEVTFEGDQWYVVEVDWGDGSELSLTLREDGGQTLAELSASDDTYTEGGLRLTAWANSYRLNVFYDAFERF